MDIKFKGELLSGEIVESNSILQGRKLNGIRIFLKVKDTFPKWKECKPETVKQIKYDNIQQIPSRSIR